MPRRSAGLTPAHRHTLNEAYFSNDPAEHFEVRLWLLLESEEPHASGPLEGITDTDTVSGRFAALLTEFGFRGGDDEVADLARRRRAVVLEALALRHHVAETVLRLYLGLLASEPEDAPWFEMSSTREVGKFQNAVQGLLVRGHTEVELDVKSVVFPAFESMPDRDGEPTTMETVTAVVQWLRHCASLLSGQGMDIASASNQLKHGLAVMPSEELLLMFVPKIADPSRPTRAEIDAGTPLINAPSIRYLHRSRPNADHSWGWELRTENADPALSLAEAMMGIQLLRILWQVGKIKHAPWLVPPSGERVEYFAHPLPHEVLARTSAKPVRWAEVLIRPRRVMRR